MNTINKFGFGVGHVLNDLVAAMWFSYLLVFLHKVLGLDTYLCGIVILVGQIADGVATPLVGLESDFWASRPHANPVRSRKLWHLAGSMCVAATFPFLFMKCFVCSDNVNAISFLIFYIPLVVIFQFGWAATQVSHLSLIPELADTRSDNVQLNSIRYAATVCSNLIVFGLTWLIFHLGNTASNDIHPKVDKSSASRWTASSSVFLSLLAHKPEYAGDNSNGNTTDNDRSNVTPADAPRFLLITGIVEGIGIVFTILFQLLTQHSDYHHRRLSNVSAHSTGGSSLPRPVEPFNEDDDGVSDLRAASPTKRAARLSWYLWLRRTDFYIIGVIYMCTRLYINVTSVYLPLYVLDSLHLDNTAIAYAPLALYTASLLVSIIIKPLLDRVGNRISFVVGCVIALASCALIYFCSRTWFYAEADIDTIAFPVIGLSLLIGVASSALYVTALASISELIGEEKSSGAFVFGAMSLTDKIANGVVIAVIQTYHPCTKNTLACSDFYIYIMAVVPGISIIVALVADLLLLLMSTFSRTPALPIGRTRSPLTVGQERTHSRVQELAGEGASAVNEHPALIVENSHPNSFSAVDRARQEITA